MHKLKIKCEAKPGLFSDELLVTIPSQTGERRFFMDREVVELLSAEGEPDGTPCACTTIGTVVAQDDDMYLVSVGGEPADLEPNRVWLEGQYTESIS